MTTASAPSHPDASKAARPGSGRTGAIGHARRLGGQVGALPAMIEARRPIADLAQQLVAARASLDALLVRVIELELDEPPAPQGARVEFDQLLRLALGRPRARADRARSSGGTTR